MGQKKSTDLQQSTKSMTIFLSISNLATKDKAKVVLFKIQMPGKGNVEAFTFSLMSIALLEMEYVSKRIYIVFFNGESTF